jgi:hypothetical protein
VIWAGGHSTVVGGRQRVDLGPRSDHLGGRCLLGSEPWYERSPLRLRVGVASMLYRGEAICGGNLARSFRLRAGGATGTPHPSRQRGCSPLTSGDEPASRYRLPGRAAGNVEFVFPTSNRSATSAGAGMGVDAPTDAEPYQRTDM